jgi:hypothetical protein
VGDTTFFGVHIYGRETEVNFSHLSHLYAANVAIESFTHNDNGPLPGIKHLGTWDIRPHRSRIVHVNRQQLARWNAITSGNQSLSDDAPMLYPVSTAEEPVISALAAFPNRIESLSPEFTQGYNESNAKRAGIIRKEFSTPQRLTEVILQPPHIMGATPFAKQPPNFRSSDLPMPSQRCNLGHQFFTLLLSPEVPRRARQVGLQTIHGFCPDFLEKAHAVEW